MRVTVVTNGECFPLSPFQLAERSDSRPRPPPGKCPRFGVDCVGTVPAALAAYAALSALRPDLLLNAGTAGGFRARGGAVGDVYISSASRHHDRRIEIPVFDAYGVWEAQAAPAAKLAQALGFKLGLVSSGNSLNCSEQEREALDACGAHVKEMECAAIAIVAAFFKTPFFAVKAITDIVDGDRVSADEFGENLAAAAAALGAALPRVIAHVAGKALEDLA